MAKIAEHRPTLDLDGIRAFRAVCDAGGFTNAGQLLNLTQSTISHQIRRLEERVGRRLLERTTRTVRPTADGEALLADARKVLDLISEAEARLSGQSRRAEIRLGVPEEIASGPLANALARFRFSQPSVRVAVMVGLSQTLRASVNRGSLDFAVLKDVPARRGSISATPLVWAGTKRLTEQATLPLAFFPEPCEYRRNVLRMLEKQGRHYEIVMTSTSGESLRAAARQELALVILARAECPPDLRLNHAHIGLPKLPRVGYGFYPTSPNSEAIICLRELIATYL